MKKNWLLLACFILLLFSFSSCRKDELVDLPAVSFSYSHVNGVLPVTISFVASVSAASSVTWDFGDGQTGTGMTTSHTYTSQGLYPVSISSSLPGQNTIKRIDTVNVFPYTQIAITQIDVTIPNPAYIHYTVRSFTGASLFDASYPTPSTSGTSLSNTPSPAVMISDLQHLFKVEIWNYTNVISNFSFRPSTYFQSTLPFPALFQKSDSQGRTVTLHVSWM
jgi:PKD repeat protein